MTPALHLHPSLEQSIRKNKVKGTKDIAPDVTGVTADGSCARDVFSRDPLKGAREKPKYLPPKRQLEELPKPYSPFLFWKRRFLLVTVQRDWQTGPGQRARRKGEQVRLRTSNLKKC